MSKKEDQYHPAFDELLSLMERGGFTGADLENLCLKYPDSAQQLRESYQLWRELDQIPVPEPSQAMNEKFYQTLSDFEGQTNSPLDTPVLKALRWVRSTGIKWAAFFVLGLAMGWLLKSANDPAAGLAVNQSPAEKSYAVLTSHSSPSEKLEAIQMAKKRNDPDAAVVEALYQTLISDPNVNVRLSAIEALLHFSRLPEAREALIDAIPHQTTPLVQMTLADVMIGLQEKRSVQELQKLIESDEVDIEVKIQLKETVEALL